jgi:16S rRNA processing protein RimM
VRGEVTVVPEAGAAKRFRPGSELATDRGNALVVAAVRPYRDRGLVVAFEGVEDRDAAEALRGLILMSDPPATLEPGEWWPSDLVGLTATSPQGAVFGQVTGVVFGDAQDRLEVTTTGGIRVEVPFVDDLVDDPADGRIVIRAPRGMFPGESE